MRYVLYVGLVCSFAILFACGMTNDEYDGANGNGSDPSIEANERAGTPGKSQRDLKDDFGYTRIQNPNNERRQMAAQDAPQIDKKQLSKIISRLVMQLDGVKDAATLVTTEEVLIVYDTDAEDRNKMADMVKKSALSVVPRWFHVYVSDDTSHFEYIERYKSLDDNSENVEESLDAFIKEMKKSPQGKKISEGENENGEMKGEMNESMDKEKSTGGKTIN